MPRARAQRRFECGGGTLGPASWLARSSRLERPKHLRKLSAKNCQKLRTPPDRNRPKRWSCGSASPGTQEVVRCNLPPKFAGLWILASTRFSAYLLSYFSALLCYDADKSSAGVPPEARSWPACVSARREDDKNARDENNSSWLLLALMLAHRQANDVLHLKGELINELLSEVERLRAAVAGHESRERQLRAELRGAQAQEQEQRQSAQLQSAGLQQLRTETARNAKRHAQEARRREELLTARAVAAEEALQSERAQQRAQLERKDAMLRTAQAQARALQRTIDNAELTKRNEAFVSQSAHAPFGQPAWLASLGAGATPTPPSLTAPEPPSVRASMGASQARHATPETTAPPAAPDDGTAARQAPLSLAQQQRAFIDGLAHALG